MALDLSRLHDLSTSLNRKSDELNESIKAFDTKLASLRLGVEAWVSPPLTAEFEEEYGVTFTTTLGYSKATGSWCLTLNHFRDVDDENSFVPLSQASRDLRMKAVDQFGKLLKAIETAAEQELKEVEKKGQLIQDLIGETK